MNASILKQVSIKALKLHVKKQRRMHLDGQNIFSIQFFVSCLQLQNWICSLQCHENRQPLLQQVQINGIAAFGKFEYSRKPCHRIERCENQMFGKRYHKILSWACPPIVKYQSLTFIFIFPPSEKQHFARQVAKYFEQQLFKGQLKGKEAQCALYSQCSSKHVLSVLFSTMQPLEWMPAVVLLL